MVLLTACSVAIVHVLDAILRKSKRTHGAKDVYGTHMLSADACDALWMLVMTGRRQPLSQDEAGPTGHTLRSRGGSHRRAWGKCCFAGKRVQLTLPTCFAALGELPADHKVRP